MYKVTQKTKVFAPFKLYKKEVSKVYKFDTFLEALKFAASEQINFFTFEKGTKKTNHKTFNYLHSLSSFIKLCKQNAPYYLGVNNYKSVRNINTYYFYLINSNQFNKLKKY